MLEVISFSNKMKEIIPEGFQFNKLATGFGWSEGPIWEAKTKSVYFTDFTKEEVYKWNSKEGLTIHRGESGCACGLAFDGEGRILSAESKTRSLSRQEKDKSLTTLALSYEGKRLNSPNDLIVKSDGSIYFTDPHSVDTGNIKELSSNGVYKIDPKTGKLMLLGVFNRPNGLAFSMDEKLLYIDDTNLQTVYVYKVKEDGTIHAGKVFAKLDVKAGQGAADGMKVDSKGNIYITGPGGISIYSPKGERLGLLKTPETAANLCFGGEDLKTLYITATTSLYSLTVGISGIATNFEK